ncbi:MAG TPA: hypothetical protein VH593_16930, partial [Ktedonobacteraceae bacterium]
AVEQTIYKMDICDMLSMTQALGEAKETSRRKERERAVNSLKWQADAHKQAENNHDYRSCCER